MPSLNSVNIDLKEIKINRKQVFDYDNIDEVDNCLYIQGFLKENEESSAYRDPDIEFAISDFPFCCGIAVIGETYFGDFNSQDIAEIFKHAEDAILKAEFGAVCYTTVAKQKVIIEALKLRKFKPLSLFKNNGTGNNITLWLKPLTKPTRRRNKPNRRRR